MPDRESPCDPSCLFLDVEVQPEPAVACSLTASDMSDRMRRWREILADTQQTALPRGVVVHQVPAARAADLAERIVAEQQCCPFLSFQLTFIGQTVQVRITAPEGAVELVKDLVAGQRESANA